MAATTTARRTPAPARKAAPTRAPEGIIKAIVAVTGVEDDVEDILTPGIFAASLKKRRPKVVFHHDFKAFAGRILAIEEWLPGDKRLPDKQPNGEPWPDAAGALVATMQFNLRTQLGAETYEWARFYAESGEAAWSIGYTVPKGAAAKRGNLRIIYGIDLYEVSLVLHGAHPMTMALEVKSAAAAVIGARAVMETKERPLGLLQTKAAAAAVLEAKAATGAGLVAAGLVVKAADTGRVLMLQRALDDEDPASGTWEFPGGHIEDGEDPLVAAKREWSEETGAAVPDGVDAGQWDSPNGVYRGHILVVPTEGSVVINADHEDRDVVNPDDPRGKQLEVTAWFDPATLPAMPSLRTEARDTPWDLLDAAADTPAPAPTAPGAPPIETKAAHRALAAARAPMEKKMARIPGSHEERRRALDAALTTALAPRKGDQPCGFVGIDATFDDHAIVTVWDEGPTPSTYRVQYSFDGDTAVLGEKVPVRLELVAVPDGETAEVPEPAARLIDPAVATIEATTEAIHAAPLEYKGLAHLRPAVIGLLDALAVKGIDTSDLLYGEDGESPLDEEEDDAEEVAADGLTEPEEETKGIHGGSADGTEVPALGKVQDLGIAERAAQDRPEDTVTVTPQELMEVKGADWDEVRGAALAGDTPDTDEDEESVTVDPADVESDLADLRR